MKRSEINTAIQTAKEMMEKYSWTLPHWAYWSKSEYENKSELRKYLNKHQMGWDVTDFGKGIFHEQGITLFCIRNTELNTSKLLSSIFSSTSSKLFIASNFCSLYLEL